MAITEWEEDYRNRCDALVRRLEALAETEHARAEKAESALREARKWPTELAKVTGLGEDCSPTEVADWIADLTNVAMERLPYGQEQKARAEAAEAALREAREELKRRDKCSYMGPMRDCPTHGESKELAEVRELLRRAQLIIMAIEQTMGHTWTTCACGPCTVWQEIEAVLSPALAQVRTPEIICVCGHSFFEHEKPDITRDGRCNWTPSECGCKAWRPVAAPVQAEEK